MEVRKEIRNAMEAKQLSLRALGKRLQLIARQVAVFFLNRSQIVEDQIAIPFAFPSPVLGRGFIIGELDWM